MLARSTGWVFAKSTGWVFAKSTGSVLAGLLGACIMKQVLLTLNNTHPH